MWSHRDEEKLQLSVREEVMHDEKSRKLHENNLPETVWSLSAADIDPMMTSEQIFIFHCVWFPLLLSCAGCGDDGHLCSATAAELQPQSLTNGVSSAIMVTEGNLDLVNGSSLTSKRGTQPVI